MARKYDPRTALTGMPADARVSQWGHRGFIKLIQRGTTAIAPGALTGTTTITSVATSNSRIRFLGYTSDNTADGGTEPNKLFSRIDLTNSTTVTATRNASDVTYGRTVSWEVTEYWPGIIKSVQRGTINNPALTSTTATITAVDTTKTEVDYLGMTTNYTAESNNVMASFVVLTNATTVTASIANVAGNSTLGYQVVEFY